MQTKVGMPFVALLASLVAIGCDRVTKHLAVTTLAGAPSRSFLADTLRIAYVENSGGFLGMGASLPAGARTGLFTVGTGLLLIVLGYAAIRSRTGGWPLLGLSLLIAGGASNWIDRIVRGSVVDFLNLGLGPLRTGIFNVADVAIMVGIGILAFGQIRRGKIPDPSVQDRGSTA